MNPANNDVILDIGFSNITINRSMALSVEIDGKSRNMNIFA